MRNIFVSKHSPFSKQFVSCSVLIMLVLAAVLAFAGEDSAVIPEKPASWVTDYAQILNPLEKQQLDQRLAQLETQTSTQIFVAIFESLPEGFYLNDFVNRLFDKWRPGTDNNDNGVLLAIFIADRDLRIETGYGVEDVLTDALAKQIISTEIVPHFKNGAYYEGIASGTNAIMAAVEGRYQTPIRNKESPNSGFGSFIIFLIVLFILLRISRSRRSSTTFSSRGARKTVGGTPIFFPPTFSSGSGRRSSGPTFGGGFGGFSGGGGASGSW